MQSRGMHPSEQGVGEMCKAEGCRRHSKKRVPTANRLHVHTSRGGQVQGWVHAAGRLTAGGEGGCRGGGCKASHCPAPVMAKGFLGQLGTTHASLACQHVTAIQVIHVCTSSLHSSCHKELHMHAHDCLFLQLQVGRVHQMACWSATPCCPSAIPWAYAGDLAPLASYRATGLGIRDLLQRQCPEIIAASSDELAKLA